MTPKFSPKHFKWDEGERIGIVTLNRPERKNPLTLDSYAELCETFHALVSQPSIRSVIITGAGENFCSGGDVHEIIGPLVSMAPAELRAFTHMTGDLIKAIRGCPQIILSAIDGICAGAGACIAMASDIRFGTPRSKVAFLFSKVGLAGCDMGACSMLPRIIGHGRASEVLFTGRSIMADEALSWGFYNRLCEPSTLLKEAKEFAIQIANGPTFAHKTTKRMLDAEWNMGITEALDAEAEAQALCMQTKDFKRAYEAFVDKRIPEFKGD